MLLHGKSFQIPATERFGCNRIWRSSDSRTVVVTDVSGRVVHRQELSGESRSMLIKKMFATGVYTITISEGEYVTNLRVIVQ